MFSGDCKQVRKRFLALEEGRLDAAATAEVRGHLSACAACRAAWEAWQADDRLLGEALKPVRAPQGVLDAAMAAIRQPVPMRRAAPRLAVGWQAAGAAAAAVLIVGAVMILTGGRTRRVGEVAALTGQPMAQQRGARAASALHLGGAIYEDCRLTTGRQDKAELSFRDGSRLVVKEGAEVALGCASEGRSAAGHGLPEIGLLRGEVLCDLKSDACFRSVGTPLGSVITAGGKFRVRYTPDVMLVVQLVDGVGVLTYPEGETRLEPGAIWFVEQGMGKPSQAPSTIWTK